MNGLLEKQENRILAFQKRMETELEFCEELFRYATVRVLAGKYAYYVLNRLIYKDIEYDLEEDGWFVMGRTLGHLREDETSPCIDWNPNHPLAKEAIELAIATKDAPL